MPADAEPTLRPEIAHILSLDVVGYSELPVNQQVDLLNQLNQQVLETASVRAAGRSGRQSQQMNFFIEPERRINLVGNRIRHRPRCRALLIRYTTGTKDSAQ